MRNLKKFLALVLAMMMAFSLMVTANAQNAKKEYNDVADAKFSEAIDVLTGMGVFKGHDGDFRPTEVITRAEAVAVLYRLTTHDVEDKQVELYAPQAYRFTDVAPDAWYAGYVGFAVDAGYVKGYNGEFMPSKTVTGYEMLAMLLRAVGYGKNGEFTGDSWRINVGAKAQSLGILKPIESTHYANTLSQGSAREVVAELSFVTATEVPTVTWTMLGGYNEYSTLLQSVDKKNPTLGEREFGLTDNTGIIVGSQATGEKKTLVSVGIDALAKDGDPQVLNNDGSYEYEDKAATAKVDDDNPAAPGAKIFKFDIKTGLDLFGHKAKVWHNGNGHAYAVIDEATVKTVFTDDNTKLDEAAKDAGFEKEKPVYESDRFSRIAAIAEGENATESKVGMYRLIDNDGDGEVDVAISLNQEVAKITQRNSTVKDGEYIYIGNGGSQFGGELKASDGNGKLLDKKLAPGSDKTLGHVVTANEIVGTTKAKNELTADDYLYETKELKPTFTGTLSTYKLGAAIGGDGSPKIVTKVTLTNGDSYELSGITGSNVPYDTDSDKEHLVDNAVAKLTSANIAAGKTYSFYEDELGRFIGVDVPNEYKFLYTTFADYEIGGVGTGSISYYAYGVDWNGNIVSTNNQIKKITLPVDENAFKESGEKTVYPGKIEDTAVELADGYNILPVTMKDQGAIVGNRIKNGANTRFVLDGNGHLSWYSEDCSEFGQRFTETKEGGTTWTITAQDAKNGFARVKSTNVDYLLTSETKFIVVTGSGTADLSVKICEGLTGLLDGASTAEISYKDADNIYFLTADTQYGNVDTSKNNTITTVILSNTNLFRYSTENLYFAAPGSTDTGVLLVDGDEAIKQYELYNNGKPAYYWIDTSKSAGEEDAENANGKDTVGTFFTLAQIDTISGQPIYKATKVTDNCKVGEEYNYVTVNNVNTAEIGDDVYKVGGAIVAEAYGENDPDITTNGIDTVEKLNHAISMGLASDTGELYDVTVAIVYDGINVSCIYVTNIVDNGAESD